MEKEITSEQAIKSEFVIQKGQAVKINLEGRSYKIRQICSKVRTKIHLLTMEAFMLTEESKKPMSLRKAKCMQKKVYSLHAKTAACYMLNKWVYVPFIFALTWRRLSFLNDESLRVINTIGASNEGFASFTAGWHLSKSLLEVSTNLFGNALKQKNERQVSAENMVKEDSQTKAVSK